MMISKNINLVISETMESIGGISYQILSGDHYHPDNWTNTADKHWWNKTVDPKHELSENQVAQLNKIREWNNEEVKHIQSKLVRLRKAFENLKINMQGELRKLRPNRVKIWNLEDEILFINKKTEQQIKKMLNNVQLGFFNSGGYDWWSVVDSCWSSAHDKLLNRNQRMLMSDRGFSW